MIPTEAIQRTASGSSRTYPFLYHFLRVHSSALSNPLYIYICLDTPSDSLTGFQGLDYPLLSVMFGGLGFTK